MGREFIVYTKQGIRTGLASGAFFAGYLVCMCVLAGQSCRDWLLFRHLSGKKEFGAGTESEIREGQNTAKQAVRNRLVVEIHLALSFLVMLFALLLMYKLTEGSKHLLTFMAAAVFITSIMETKYYRKAVLVGLTFAYLYSYMAVEPDNYQVPFVEEEMQASLEEWQDVFAGWLVLDREHAPCYENVVIWVFSDTVEGTSVITPWQPLYALPKGFGISCCMGDYVSENFESLESRYLVAPVGGDIELRCREAGCRQIHSDNDIVLYEINVPSE